MIFKIIMRKMREKTVAELKKKMDILKFINPALH